MTRRQMILVAGLVFALVPPASAQADTTTHTYFTIRPDVRMCQWPLCGGYWVKRANIGSTRDHSGTYLPECYVASIDWQASGLSKSRLAAFRTELAAGRGLIRGEIVKKSHDGFGILGALAATEAWQAASTTAPSGAFYRLEDNGVRCATTPCFWIHGAKLNSPLDFELSSLDLGPTGGIVDKRSTPLAALSSTGLLAAGTRRTILTEGPAGDGLRLVVSQYYRRLQP